MEDTAYDRFEKRHVPQEWPLQACNLSKEKELSENSIMNVSLTNLLISVQAGGPTGLSDKLHCGGECR